MKWSIVWCGALIGALVAGCPGGEPLNNDDVDDDNNGPAVLQDAVDLCVVYSRGQSQFLSSLFGGGFERCSATDQPDELSAETLAAIRASCSDPQNPTLQEFQLALTGGRVIMNVDNVKACADFVPEGQAEPPAVCDDLFESLVGAGGDCEQSWDCAGELLCQAVDVTTQVLTCAEPAAAGESCLPQTDFVAPSARTCGEGLTCTDFVCVADEPAVAPQPGDPCFETLDCGDELRCELPEPQGDEEEEVEGVCGPLRTVGQACESSDDCTPLPDDQGTPTTACGVNGTCVVVKQDGAACDVTIDVCAARCSVCRASIPRAAATTCQDRGATGEACRDTGDCRHNLVCGSENTCIPGGGAGAACESPEDCRDTTLTCGGDGTCVVLPGLGAACGPDTTETCSEGACVQGECRAGVIGDPCTEDGECTSGALCIDEACAAAPTSGPCSVDGACAEGFACSPDSTCEAVPGLGESCDELPCAEGLFCSSTNVCATIADTGADCDLDEGCRSGTCVDGTCGAVAVGCTSDKGFFGTFVILALMVPLRLRRRRR
jgi:hypothetical protein